MTKQFIDGALEVLKEDKRQICKQAAHIIAELDKQIEKMKCCGNCDNLWQEECSLSPESKNKCLENKSYLLWELKK